MAQVHWFAWKFIPIIKPLCSVGYSTLVDQAENVDPYSKPYGKIKRRQVTQWEFKVLTSEKGKQRLYQWAKHWMSFMHVRYLKDGN